MHHLLILFTYLTLPKLTRCLDGFQTVTLNELQIHTVDSENSLSFQVLADPQLGIGKFDVFVTPMDSIDSVNFLLTRQICNDNNQIELYHDEIYYSQNTTGINFYANSSEDQCFKIELRTELQPFSANFSVMVTYSPIDCAVQLNKSLKFELGEHAEKRFSYGFGNSLIEMLMIKIQKNPPLNSSETLNLQIKQDIGTCIQSHNHIIGELVWLCYIVEPRDIYMFSVCNHGSTGLYEMIINEMKPQEIGADSEQIFSSSIYGIGSLFLVNIFQIGVLKIEAKSEDGQTILVTASNSMFNLFGILNQEPNRLKVPGFRSDDQNGLLIQNKNTGNHWYYFIPETKTGKFRLKSHFVRQMTLDVNTDGIYYIDPEIYEYQHIKVNLGQRNYLEKFEAVLHSQHQNSMMNLYYDISFQETIIPFLTEQSSSLKQASPTMVQGSQISLSFLAGSYDFSVYLTIHAASKGYYKLKISKLSPISSVEILFIIAFISYVTFYILSCLFKVYKLSKSPEYSQSQYSVRAEDAATEESDVDRYTRQVQVLIDSNDETYDHTNLASMVEKLEMQNKLQRDQKIEDERHISQLETNIEPGQSKDCSEEDELCEICYEGSKTVKFEPCKHAGTCVYCALTIIQISPKCPFCREKIVEVEIIDQAENNLNKEEQ